MQIVVHPHEHWACAVEGCKYKRAMKLREQFDYAMLVFAMRKCRAENNCSACAIRLKSFRSAWLRNILKLEE
jgi:hypothetical protein